MAHFAQNDWFDKRENKIKYHDICNYTETDLLAWSDMDTTKFLPYKTEQCQLLLSEMHNINNIKDAINWSNTSNLDDHTKKRILNCSWKVYKLSDQVTMIQLEIVKQFNNYV